MSQTKVCSAVLFFTPQIEYSTANMIGIVFVLQSYGGFVAAHALGDEHSNVFSCGVSVAPVTDFRYYGRNQIEVCA